MSAARGSKKKGGKPPVPLSDVMLECYEILKFLQTRQEANPFLEPVDWELYGLSDYPEIITHPMDLGTVQTKLEEGKYKDPNAFYADVKLIWDNCMKYNRPDSDLYLTAEKLSKQFDKKMSKFKSASSSSSSSTKSSKVDSSTNREPTRADRLKFSSIVNQLTPDQLGHIVEMIQNECPEALNEEGEEDIEIEINNLDGNTLYNVNNYAQNCVNGNEGGTKKQKTK